MIIHEIKTKSYDVIDIQMKIRPLKGRFGPYYTTKPENIPSTRKEYNK